VQFDLWTLFPGFSKIADSKHFAFDMMELDTGKYSFPYHLSSYRGVKNDYFRLMTIGTPMGFEIA
jgi:hypothetical protein